MTNSNKKNLVKCVHTLTHMILVYLYIVSITGKDRLELTDNSNRFLDVLYSFEYIFTTTDKCCSCTHLQKASVWFIYESSFYEQSQLCGVGRWWSSCPGDLWSTGEERSGRRWVMNDCVQWGDCNCPSLIVKWAQKAHFVIELFNCWYWAKRELFCP